MTPERWQKVKAVVEEALEIAPAFRSDFLNKSCGGDRDLRSEVESLLDFDNTQSRLLEQNAFAVVMENDFNEKPAKSLIGAQIGNYRILKELGAGGMGAVFLAERADGAFQQQVALKLIKHGMDSETVLRRFLNERQILATLEHPNIAHLIDGGTSEDGSPFFVMEYVAGKEIISYASQENLDLEARLNLFREVCAAVSFAHRNLVIHRDLKPSNILVTDDETPKLLDFGIAKLLRADDNGETATHSFIFTPEYASPEQVRGEKLTTATDVYSLGVILYELLTESRPYKTDSRNIGDIMRVVCETEPTVPSRAWHDSETRKPGDTASTPQVSTNNAASATRRVAAAQLKGDLDNIILKSLRKEPERRYSSVEQFSEDIRRHLKGLPVTARSDTWSYRAEKFVRRNALAVGFAGLVVLALVGGIAATVWQAQRAEGERALAEQRFADVRTLTNSFLFEFHEAIKNLPGSTPARELVVKRAVEYLDKLAAQSNNDLSLQRELASAYAEIGQIQGNSYYSNLGDTEGAMKSYQRSLEIRQRLAEANLNNHELQHELADSHEGVGDMLYTINDLKGGLQSYENAAAIREKIVAAEPNNLEYRYSLANLLGKRGDIKGMEGFPNLGDTPGALESYRQGVSVYEELIKAEPENEKFNSGYATMLHFYGMLQTTTGDAKGAIANGQKAISIFESLIASNPNNAKYETHLMSALVFMRYPLLDEGRTEEAIVNARRVIQTMEKMIAADPKNAFMKRSLSVSYNSLGKCLLQAGDAKGAIENHRRSLELVEELSGGDPINAEGNRDISLTKQFLAEAQLETGELDAALINLRQSVSDLEAELNKGSSNVQVKDDLAACLVNIGKIMTAKDDLKSAADYFRRATSLSEEAMQKTPFNIKFKTRNALSHFEAGKSLAKLAQTESGENRATVRRESCNYFKRSLDLWNEMRQTGTLSTINANRPDEVSRELDKCG